MLANAVFAAPLLQMLSSKSEPNSILVSQAPSTEENHHIGSAVFALTEHYKQWLLALDNEPEALNDLLEIGQRIKLGVFHERLWQFFLANNGLTTLLAANLPARNNGRDLGEFDLVYQHPDMGVVHLEIASKYYLARDTHTSEWSTWLGPGKKDRLDLKLNHSINKQMNLADQPIALEQLLQHIANHNNTEQASIQKQNPVAEITASTPLIKHLHIGGRLFYRESLADIIKRLESNEQTLIQQAGPKDLNSNHACGHWLLFSEWKILINTISLRHKLVYKPNWLDTINGNLASDFCLTEENITTPEMAIYTTDNSYNATNHQASFCFIVPDDWLD